MVKSNQLFILPKKPAQMPAEKITLFFLAYTDQKKKVKKNNAVHPIMPNCFGGAIDVQALYIALYNP